MKTQSWSAAALFRTAAVISIKTELKDSRILGRRMWLKGWLKKDSFGVPLPPKISMMTNPAGNC